MTLLAARSLPGNLFCLLSQAVIEGSAVPLFLVLFTAYLLLSDQWICDVSSPGVSPAPVSLPAWVVPDGAGTWLLLLGAVSSEVEWTLMLWKALALSPRSACSGIRDPHASAFGTVSESGCGRGCDANTAS